MKKTILSYITCFIFSVTFSQSDLEKLEAIEKDYANIDNAVFLIEEISTLGLKDGLKQIQDCIQNEKLAPFKDRLIKLAAWMEAHTTQSMISKSISSITSIYIKNKIDHYNSFTNGYYTLQIQQLYHHTRRLFEMVVGNEKVFDENSLSIYYQFRNELRQMIENELTKRELTQQISTLQGEVRALQTSMNILKTTVDKNHSELKSKSNTIHQLTDDQQRDERVGQLFRSRKWRYSAIRFTKHQIDSITLGKTRKLARKDLKKALKN